MRQCPKCGKRYLEANARICDVDGAVLDLLVVASERDRLVGTTVNGRYNVDGVLGDGGMGVVYRASGTDGRTYAIKVLRAEYSAEEDLVLRFEQEAQAAHDVHNPHIVEIYEWGSLPDGSRFFVMEFLDGKSLGDLLARMPKPPGSDRREPMSEPFTLHIAMQIAEGLSAAHAAGVVHRDIKPDNFHIVRRPDEEYFVKILDFGIAKVQNSKAARTRTGSVFGTPHYMSPEQASGDRNIDAKTDIYGLGVMMYEMVVGKIPFDADNLMGILTAHLYHTPTPPRVYPECAELSPAFEAVILKCLAKTREARYDSIADLYDDLARFRDGVASRALEDQESHTVQFRRSDFAALRASAPPPPPRGYDDDDSTATQAEIQLPPGMVNAARQTSRLRRPRAPPGLRPSPRGPRRPRPRCPARLRPAAAVREPPRLRRPSPSATTPRRG
ncbi:MAG: serine/threonine-protein kinase [Polyangiales bacterium]